MKSSSEHDKESFERFLKALSSGKDPSADLYHELRDKLVRYCALRGVIYADEAADEALDRVIKKLGEGTHVDNVTNYSYGVARLVVLERIRKQATHRDVIDTLGRSPQSDNSDGDNLLMEYLMECLKELDGDLRELILAYFSSGNSSGKKGFRFREAMAASRGITVNSLRLKVFRTKKVLGKCVEGKKL